MPTVTIKGLYNLDGEYPLDLVFTHRDFRDIKRIANVRANEVTDALDAGDMDVIVALAAIALRRSGKQFDVEQLWDAEAGNILLDLTEEEEADADPPTSTPASSSGDERGANGSSSPSGMPTSEPTELSLVSESPSPSGTPAQASSA